MSFRIICTSGYLKRAAKFLRCHPELLPQYEKTLKLLSLNPSHPSLRLHPLASPLRNLHPVSINISYRITPSAVAAAKQGHNGRKCGELSTHFRQIVQLCDI